MNFKDYLNELYISLLIPKEFYNNLLIKNNSNYKTIRLSIIPLSYDNIISNNETIKMKKNKIIPILLNCNDNEFNNLLFQVCNELNNEIKLYYDKNLQKIIYFIKYNEIYNYFINTIMLLFPIINKICEIISLKYLRYPIININSKEEKINFLFLKSRQLEDKDKYFYYCNYDKQINKNKHIIINYKFYYDNVYDNIDLNSLFNLIK